MESYTIVTRSAKKGKAKLGPSANTRSSKKKANIKPILTGNQIRSRNIKIAKLTISTPPSSAPKMMQSSGVLTRGMIYRAKGKTKEIDNILPIIFEVGTTSSSVASRKKGTKVENSARLGKAKLDSDPQVHPKSNKGF
ncbi:hypothetical protein R3W88_031292 [Solanum pinnatisectum]|uniref:Uncharacterized protein n=1 Tax=Solanum pinnatisectum TaxID=50273 RepID=A0AAV9LNH7_9SOLN|nr:hypothetical protein R3W88_031292 [Solanum pinnatisectum]